MAGSCGDKCLNPSKYSSGMYYDGGAVGDCDFVEIPPGGFMPMNDLLGSIMSRLCVIAEDGQDGADGVDGMDGLPGVAGADGQDGADGVDGINGVDGVNGVDGQDGIDGVDGVDGVDGCSLLQGNGVPLDANGKDCDSYIDTDSNGLYVKVAGSWMVTGNIGLVGPKGFKATRTTNLALVTGGVPVAVGFDDDFTSPNYDAGNNFLTTYYVIPDAVSQRFQLENFTIENDSQSHDYVIEILVNGVVQASVSKSLVGLEVFNFAAISTPYLVPTPGDYATVNVTCSTQTGGGIFYAGAIFSVAYN